MGARGAKPHAHFRLQERPEKISVAGPVAIRFDDVYLFGVRSFEGVKRRRQEEPGPFQGGKVHAFEAEDIERDTERAIRVK